MRVHIGIVTEPFDHLPPDRLEERYRSDPQAFRDWMEAHPSWSSHPTYPLWEARWNADGIGAERPDADRKVHFGYPIIIATLIALPFLIPYWQTGRLDPEWSQPWLGLFAFLPLMLWHAVRTSGKRVLHGRIAVGVAIGVALVMVLFHQLLLPWPRTTRILGAMDILDTREAERVLLILQTHDLMLVHGPMLLLGITGGIWTWSRNGGNRVDFIRNGLQVVIYTALIAAAGGLFTLLSVVMAEMVGIEPETIGIHLICWGGSGVLVFAHHVWLRQPDALKPVLPLIAGLFIPLFVLLESGFLLTYLSKGLSELTRDRQELLVFNLLLGAVIGLVLLHSALQRNATRLGQVLVAILVVLGIFADLVGILAIGTRLLEMGLTPNRLAVFVTNVLFLCTLLALVPGFVPRWRERGWPEISEVLNRALLAFVAWTAVVTLVFPSHQLWINRNLDSEAFHTTIEQAEAEALMEESIDSITD